MTQIPLWCGFIKRKSPFTVEPPVERIYYFNLIMKHLIFLLCAFSLHQSPYAGYWQQEVDYVMDIRMDVETFDIVEHNSSPIPTTLPTPFLRCFTTCILTLFSRGVIWT